MNVRDALNHYLYPAVETNVRRKDIPKYDQKEITAGQLEYFFFVTDPGNIFERNTKLPLSGTEVYFITGISAYLETNIGTTALVDALNEILQQSYLQITVNNRMVSKFPGLDIMKYMLTNTLTATNTGLFPLLGGNKNKNRFLGRNILNCPILMNSNDNFEFKFVTTSAVATAFDGIKLNLVLHGIQLDKLESFIWDELKDKQYRQVPVTYYDTIVIPNANQQIFNFFANPAKAKNLFSQTFPLSNIETFSLQNMEVFVNQPDTPIEPTTIWNSRIHDVLNINVDEVVFYNADLQDMLSLIAGLSTALVSTPDTTMISIMHERHSYVVRIPIEFPANSKVSIDITQPGTSLGITGEITLALRGVETGRVA